VNEFAVSPKKSSQATMNFAYSIADIYRGWGKHSFILLPYQCHPRNLRL